MSVDETWNQGLLRKAKELAHNLHNGPCDGEWVEVTA